MRCSRLPLRSFEVHVIHRVSDGDGKLKRRNTAQHAPTSNFIGRSTSTHAKRLDKLTSIGAKAKCSESVGNLGRREGRLGHQ
jgi:hypothetical protein